MVTYKTVHYESKYLTPGDEGSFLDHEKKSPEPKYDLLAECPKCLGYGGWNLKVNEYGPGKHFQAHCSNCNGWGYVRPESADHVHEFTGMDEKAANEFRATKGKEPVRYTRGRCCHNAICSVCGEYRFTDSSD